MAKVVVMPKLGLTMTEGTVSKWLKKVGDAVNEGEPLFEVETDKLTNTIEAKRTAALALDAMVAPYKGIGSHEYRTESREVAGLIAVLGTTAAKTHVATLALTQELSALEEANTAFDIVMSSKQMEEAARSPQTTLSTDQLRAQLDQAYAAIVQIVNAYAVIQSSTQIENFITQVNALVTLVKRSAAKPAAKEEESGDDTGENKEQGGDVNGDVSGEA